MEWHVLSERWCDAAQSEAKLMELRVYPPSDMMPDGTYLVAQRRCTLDVQCNCSDISCRWAFTNELNDPFELP